MVGATQSLLCIAIIQKVGGGYSPLSPPKYFTNVSIVVHKLYKAYSQLGRTTIVFSHCDDSKKTKG